jgi:hypothetical protein
VVQVTRGHLAGFGDPGRREIRVVQVGFDVIDDADAVRRERSERDCGRSA